MVMEKLNYRKKLTLDLIDNGISPSSICVYLAGSKDKKPSKYLRLKISLYGRTKHPEDKWGLEIKPFLLNKKMAEQSNPI